MMSPEFLSPPENCLGKLFVYLVVAGDRLLTVSIGPNVMALAMAKKRPTESTELFFQVAFLQKNICTPICVQGQYERREL